MKVILASESPYRVELLARLGVPFETRPHECDERSIERAGTFEEHAERLAILKARSIGPCPGSLVIGSDQILVFGEVELGKPGTPERAIEQLEALQGRSHQLITGLCVLGDEERSTVVRHIMHMRPLGRAEIERYVAQDCPEQCCGSYKVESLGISLMDRIEGPDFTAIIGLPLIELARSLRAFGLKVP